MVSQSPDGLVHLLATSEDGSHPPQVFRMRWDQPLRRFMKAYATFRQAGPEAEFVMTTPSHEGRLDPGATASVYGLTDGDQVIFAPCGAATGATQKAAHGPAGGAGQGQRRPRPREGPRCGRGAGGGERPRG